MIGRIRGVVGFLFSEDRKQVVLIKKLRPDFQAGLYNGIGGKVEKDEAGLEALVREFREETGAEIEEWEPFCVFADRIFNYDVVYYRAFGDVGRCKTMTDEQVEVVSVASLPQIPVLQNLTWLIPMALDPHLCDGWAVWRKP